MEQTSTSDKLTVDASMSTVGPALLLLSLVYLNVRHIQCINVKVGGRLVRYRILLYADDAVVFIKPTKQNIDNLAEILTGFGHTTGLHTNINKTTVTPISCTNINLREMLQNVPMRQANFPLKFLGLPLSVSRLRKIAYRPLVEKAAAKISGWYGRHLTQAGRVCLTKSVLSSQPVYLLTVIKTSKDLLDDIDKMRKRFLWAGDGALTG